MALLPPPPLRAPRSCVLLLALSSMAANIFLGLRFRSVFSLEAHSCKRMGFNLYITLHESPNLYQHAKFLRLKHSMALLPPPPARTPLSSAELRINASFVYVHTLLADEEEASILL